MRGLLSLMLAIPLAVGCGDDGGDDKPEERIEGGYLRFLYNDALCESLVHGFVEAMTALGWSGSANIADNADC